MKTYCVIYISEKGYLFECQLLGKNQKTILETFNLIKNKGDEVLYICPHTCKITDKRFLPVLVSLEKIDSIIEDLNNDK